MEEVCTAWGATVVVLTGIDCWVCQLLVFQAEFAVLWLCLGLPIPDLSCLSCHRMNVASGVALEEMCGVRDASVVVTGVGVDELCIYQLLVFGVEFSITVLGFGTAPTSVTLLVLSLSVRGVW